MTSRNSASGAFAGKVAIVTGAASGIVPIVADVAREESAVLAVAAAIDQFGKLDVLINNAAIIINKPVVDMSLEEWNGIQAVNATGAFLFSREAMRAMAPAKAGAIVNVGSYACYQAFPLIAAYAASKGALAQLTRALSLEAIEHGIRVRGLIDACANVPALPGHFLGGGNATYKMNRGYDGSQGASTDQTSPGWQSHQPGLFSLGMDQIAALQFFVRVVESGSFSQAGRELGVGQPAVSKQVAALERRLGAQLLNRTSRGMRPTPAGADFYEAAVRILGDLHEAENRVAHGHERPSGAVRVAVPPILSSMMIVPRLPDFFLRFPDVSVEVVVSERYADLVQEGLDLAIRIGHLDSSGLVARKIGSMQLATVASPGYLERHGVPSTPSDLGTHQLLANRHLGAISDWYFANSEQDIVSPVGGRFSGNSPADMHAAVLAGLGIVQSARVLFEAELRAGRVIEVLADFVADPFPIHVLYASSRIPHRVRVMSDFIQQCLDEQPSLRLQQPYSFGE